MRFMVMIKSDAKTEAGEMPGEEVFVEMGKYNDELTKAGVMLSGEGLQPSSKGARIQVSGGELAVANGPFSNPEELVAGFWIFQTASLDEAIEWAKRCPNPTGETFSLEIRQIFEMSDFEGM